MDQSVASHRTPNGKLVFVVVVAFDVEWQCQQTGFFELNFSFMFHLVHFALCALWFDDDGLLWERGMSFANMNILLGSGLFLSTYLAYFELTFHSISTREVLSEHISYLAPYLVIPSTRLTFEYGKWIYLENAL